MQKRSDLEQKPGNVKHEMNVKRRPPIFEERASLRNEKKMTKQQQKKRAKPRALPWHALAFCFCQSVAVLAGATDIRKAEGFYG